LLNFFSNDFDSSMNDISMEPTGSIWGFLSSAQNDNLLVNNFESGSGSAIPFVCTGCGGTFNMIQASEDTPTLTGPIFQLGSSIVINTPAMDVEIGNTAQKMGLYIYGNNTALVNGGEIAAANAAPPIMIKGTVQKVTLNGVQLSNFGGTPPSLIHIDGSAVPPVIENPNNFNGGTTPLCDAACQVVGKAAGAIYAPSAVGGTNVVTGRNEAFQIAISAGTPATEVVSFNSGNPFAAAPFCTAQDVTTGETLKQSAVSATGLTLARLSGNFGSDTLSVGCPYN
jgi:hypothetical protein